MKCPILRSSWLMQQNEKSNLGQKNYRRLKNVSPKTNIRTFTREKKIFIKISKFFELKKHQTNPVSRLFIYRAKNKLVKWDASNSYLHQSLTGLQFRKTYRFALCRVASQLDAATISSNVFSSCTIQNNCGNLFSLYSYFTKAGRRLGPVYMEVGEAPVM